MNVVDRKLPTLSNPYEGRNIMDQDNSKLAYDLTLRVLIMKDIRSLVGRKTQYKAALVLGRLILFSTDTIINIKPTFKFTDCKMSDLPRATKVCISIFVKGEGKENETRELVGYTNFRLFNQFGICHFRETLKVQMAKNMNPGFNLDQEANFSADPKFFLSDGSRDHFFIGELAESEISHSELSVRLSIDDGHAKHGKLKPGKTAIKSRPSQLVRFKPTKEISVKNHCPNSGICTRPSYDKRMIPPPNDCVPTSRDDVNTTESLAMIKSTIGPFDMTRNEPEIKTLFNRIVKDESLRKLIMAKAPNQVHKVIQAYYYINITRQKIAELYDILSVWDTRNMSAEVFILLLTKEFQERLTKVSDCYI